MLSTNLVSFLGCRQKKENMFIIANTSETTNRIVPATLAITLSVMPVIGFPFIGGSIVAKRISIKKLL